ncbi:hypothetical protein ES689_06335 [Frigoribacterium sp. ACAM 257]|uniref:hypothetical protein n=1 Tax=Frigoribacterium sp. ACAM 257 TaxID=2508998 RepID=UPI0011B9FD23|nr:hypothetical protein [Frigoribacterium sp. ACAM 257]TWX38289.1 hypothetical protein ES689_06335 [Frigoribacterium sp. ACAM 257]
MSTPRIFFSDQFGIPRAALDKYGAFDINLLADVRLFVDPFLLFNSKKAEYQALHEDVLRYLRFLKTIAGDDLPSGTVKDLFRFQEVKQNWFGYCELGNEGRGLGLDFAKAMREALGRALSNFGEETGTKSSHLEKVALIRPRVGKDNISDFTTNLIKHYLVDYTERFAKEHIDPAFCATVGVRRVRFNYDTQTWVDEPRYLPVFQGDYVLLTPVDMLIHDDVWINHGDMVKRYPQIVEGVDDDVQRARVDQYFRRQLAGTKDPTPKQIGNARERTLAMFPSLLDIYIRLRENDGDGAAAVSDEEIEYLRAVFVSSLSKVLEEFWSLPDMAARPKAPSLEEVRYRVNVFKRWVEDQEGYRTLNDVRGKAAAEKDLQRVVFLALQASRFDVNAEVNNGRGPVDFKVSRGSADSALLEIKLASNSHLRRNLQNQVDVYRKANNTRHSVTMIIYYTREEKARVDNIVAELGLTDEPDVVLINARNDDKPSGSKA